MEKVTRSKKRITFLLNKFAQNMNPIEMNRDQSIAKEMLIHIADNEHQNQTNIKKQKINGWFNYNNDQNKMLQSIENKTIKNYRKSVHMRPFAEARAYNKSCNSIQRNHQSVIPFLKSQLQKLESPQKTKQNQDRKRKVQYLENKIKRKKQPLLVQHLLQTKRPSIRIKYNSSEKPKTNVNWIHNFYDTKPRNLFTRQTHSRFLQCKTANQHLQNIRQARKNRTLRNILF